MKRSKKKARKLATRIKDYETVLVLNLKLDHNYLYFIDRKGNIARTPMKRSKKKAKKLTTRIKDYEDTIARAKGDSKAYRKPGSNQ